MGFSDLFFLYLFLPLCLAFYFLAKTQYRNGVLIAFSLIFYSWGEPVYIWLLLLASCLNYILGRAVTAGQGAGSSRLSLGIGMLLNLGLLVGVKYTGFFVENINNLLNTEIPVPDIHIPIGLGFFTLRGISYLIDCYRDRIDAERKLPDFLLYMTLFPVTAQGPLVRYETIGESLSDRRTTVLDFSEGMSRIVIGLAKKVILADRLGAIAFPPQGAVAESQTVLGSWYSVIIFTLYIYFDLSGYSDIAIGTGRLFGFKFRENFRYPFMCRDITDFQSRWHISLTSFFKDYVLTLPVLGKERQYCGIALMWLLLCLWHGACLSFGIWGLYFALFLIAEKLMGKASMNRIPLPVRHIYSKLVIIIGFAIFRFTDLSQLTACLKNMFFISGADLTDTVLTDSVQSNIFLIIAAIIGCFPWLPVVKKKLSATPNPATYMAVQTIGTIVIAGLLIVSSILLVNTDSRPFFYMQF